MVVQKKHLALLGINIDSPVVLVMFQILVTHALIGLKWYICKMSVMLCYCTQAMEKELADLEAKEAAVRSPEQKSTPALFPYTTPSIRSQT